MVVNEDTKIPVWEAMNAVRSALDEVREEHDVSDVLIELVDSTISKYLLGE